MIFAGLWAWMDIEIRRIQVSFRKLPRPCQETSHHMDIGRVLTYSALPSAVRGSGKGERAPSAKSPAGLHAQSVSV